LPEDTYYGGKTTLILTINSDAVRQAIELGDLVHLDTASEEYLGPKAPSLVDFLGW
jgi:hypothetical protein